MNPISKPIATSWQGLARRRAFLNFCALTASLLALPSGSAPILARVLSTPGVVIDGNVVHAGGIPGRDKIDGWLAA